MMRPADPRNPGSSDDEPVPDQSVPGSADSVPGSADSVPGSADSVPGNSALDAGATPVAGEGAAPAVVGTELAGDAGPPASEAGAPAPAQAPPLGPPDDPGFPAEPRRRRRRRTILVWVSGVLAVLLLGTATGAYLVYRHLNANLHQVDVSGLLGRQPVDLHPQAENILVIGSDTRIGQGHGYGSAAELNTDHSDTLLIVHVAADRQWADVMSIPRDSWVNIPGCKMGNGQTSSPQTFKINEAFTLGNLYGNKTQLGTACTIRTVEQNTGIHIDHFVDVNFSGLKDMVNAVGGVPECNTTPIDDPKSGLHLTAGHHVLNGRQALGYVRARYSLGDGSDLERIGRQQAFMASMINQVKSKLLNPLAIYHFLDAATKSLTIDTALGGIHGLYDLASSLKNLPAGKVTFFTLPTYPRSYVDPTDTANLLWTQPQDSLIFQAFRDDKPVDKALIKHPRTPQLSPGKIRVMVLNGTTQYGLQDSVGSALQQEGFVVAHTGNADVQTVTQTVIRYHAGQESQALLLAKRVHGAALLGEKGPAPATGRITLLLGSDYGTTTTIGSTVAPQPASSFAPRTGSQNICT
jgi:LCP family protein required for cell wall assembly